jgi:hypothetical protein
VRAGATSSTSSSSSGTPSHATGALCVQAPPAWSNTSPGCSSPRSHGAWAPCQRPCKRGGRASSCRRLRESAAAARARRPYPRRLRKLRPASVRVRSGRQLPASGRASESALFVVVRELRPVSIRVRGGRREAGVEPPRVEASVERPRPDLHGVEWPRCPRMGRHAPSQRRWGERRMGSGRLDGNYRRLPRYGRASFLSHQCKSRRRVSLDSVSCLFPLFSGHISKNQ